MYSVSGDIIFILLFIIEIHNFERNVENIDESTKTAACESHKKDLMHLEAQLSSSIWKANQSAWLQWVAFCNIFNPVSVFRSV